MIRSMRDVDVSNKRVLVRVDFNVDLDRQRKIIDSFRIESALPTIRYLIEHQAKIILMCHFGEPAGKIDKKFKLDPIKEKLESLLNQPVIKTDDCVGEEAGSLVSALKPGEIILLENLRFHKEEKENDENFARSLAQFGDIYVNDAFAVCHRQHASVAAITKFIQSYAGLLLEKEINVLGKVMKNPSHPLVVIMGGTKISTKIGLIKNFLPLADNIILGGALANTVLHAQGLAIGKSIFEEEMVQEVKNLSLTDTKLHIPVDAIASSDTTGQGEVRTAPVGKTKEEESILDIGPETELLFKNVIAGAKTIIWNGPMGLFENEAFAHGSRAIAEAVAGSGAYSIIGGGETICLADELGIFDKFSHVSTGGGAMLKFLAGEKLPGIEALERPE